MTAQKEKLGIMCKKVAIGVWKYLLSPMLVQKEIDIYIAPSIGATAKQFVDYILAINNRLLANIGWLTCLPNDNTQQK